MMGSRALEQAARCRLARSSSSSPTNTPDRLALEALPSVGQKWGPAGRQQVIRRCNQQQQQWRLKLPFVGGKTTNFKLPLVATSLILLLAITSHHAPGGGLQLALASPPVDYLILTSQLATAQTGSPQNVTSLLPSIKSIYAPQSSPDSGGSSTGSAHQNNNNKTRLHLEALADRVLNLVRNSSHTHDNNQIKLEDVQYAWNVMERQAELYMKNRVLALRPFVQELLAEAQLSAECSQSISHWLDNLTELKQWATLMWNSWGQFPPAGVFQGSYTDLGSYSGCMSIKDNELIGESQYCMLDFQPIVPTRPRFHSIFKRILSHNEQSQKLDHGDFELNPATDEISSRHSAHGFASHRYKDLFSKSSSSNNNKYLKRTIDPQSGASSNLTANGLAGDLLPDLNITLKAEALIEVAKKAQYFYYVTFRIGACLPSKCSHQDVERLAQSGKYLACFRFGQVWEI